MVLGQFYDVIIVKIFSKMDFWRKKVTLEVLRVCQLICVMQEENTAICTAEVNPQINEFKGGKHVCLEILEHLVERFFFVFVLFLCVFLLNS